MRAEPDQFQAVVIGLAIDEHKIGSDVAIPMTLTVDQCVIPIARIQRAIGCQDSHDCIKLGVELSGVPRRSAFVSRL
jgi:hypothetical protein